MNDKLARLFEALGTVYDYKEQTMGNTNAINLVSDPFELISSFGEGDDSNRGAFAVATLCDEFTVQVGYDDFPTTTTIVLSQGGTNNQMWMEYLSGKALSPTVGSSAAWGVSETPTDIYPALNNGYGYKQTFVPGSRTVRFRSRVTASTTNTAGGSKPTVISQTVTGRIRNEGANRLILQALYDRFGDLHNLIEQREERQSRLEREMERFAPHRDPSNPLLIPAIMRHRS